MKSFRVRAAVAAAALVLVAGVLAATPIRAAAQYFGRNKVQYQTFKFRVMHTQHYDLYFYPAESLAATDAARMAERWYVRHRATFGAEFPHRSIILYADHADFEQTNLVGGFIDQSTEAVTEPLRGRAIVPFTGSYADFDHVLGHELVHVFQFDIANGEKGGLNAFSQLPQWMYEGMAEYLSLGRDDPNTATWLRDALLYKELPTFKRMNSDPSYFPYRYGEAMWAYIGGRWGDEAVNQLLRVTIESGWENAVRRVLGVSTDTLFAQWDRAIQETYTPLIQGRDAPEQTGTQLLRRAIKKYPDQDVGPALSPDGRYVAFLSARNNLLLGINLLIADTKTGKIVRTLTGPNTDSHFDAVSFSNSSGAWSPDGKKFAAVVFVDGNNAIQIFDIKSGKAERQLRFKHVTAVTDLTWSPDGKSIALSGMAGGISDLYVYHLDSNVIDQLTNDKYAELQPTWSPDGQSLAFVTDRDPRTDFDKLQYSPMRIGIMNVATHDIRVLHLFDDAKAINPQYSPDGKSVYFISNRGGFDDIYRTDLASGQIFQLTRSATGVSGFQELSPALSVAQRSGEIMFSLFQHRGYSLHSLSAEQAGGAPVTGPTDTASVAGVLPPTNVPGGGAVTQRIADAITGLPPKTDLPVTAFDPKLSLEYLGSQGVGIGVSSGPFGGVGAGGGVAAFFTDELDNRVLGAAIEGGGDIRNFGGQVSYQNLAHRWNWGVGISHTPFITGFASIVDTTVTTGGGQALPAELLEQTLQRTYFEEASAQAQYPFSMTRRFEVSFGLTHVGYGIEVDRFLAVGDQIVSEDRTGGATPPSVNYASASAALVGDNSSYGFTSPIVGGRYRFQITPTFGGLQFESALADYRRYFYARPFTFAFRGMHIGRYGQDAEDPRLFPLYVGDQQLVRGYEVTNLDASECKGPPTGCPVFDRLLGSRLAVANFEIRFPLLGPAPLALINFPFLPTEIAPFFDAGEAWTAERSPTFDFATNSLSDRIPVFSAGLSARVNLLGYAVIEIYYAYPFQRPDKGGHFGFQLSPGW